MELTHNGTLAIFTVNYFFSQNSTFLCCYFHYCCYFHCCIWQNSFLLWTVSIPLLWAAQQLKSIMSISNCFTGYVPGDTTLGNGIEESVYFHRTYSWSILFFNISKLHSTTILVLVWSVLKYFADLSDAPILVSNVCRNIIKMQFLMVQALKTGGLWGFSFFLNLVFVESNSIVVHYMVSKSYLY